MKAIVKKNHSESEGQGGVFYSFAFVHEDGSAILRSGPYRSKDSAYKGVRAVKKNCLISKRYIVDRSADGKHSFKIKSGNGVAIVDSASFSTEEQMQEILTFIKTHMPDCEVEFQKSPSPC